MAAHGGPSGSTTVHTQSHHIQHNVIKTMILVSAFYAISWMPINIYYILIANTNVPYIDSLFYVTTFVAFLYISANPFIYATKFDPVRQTLTRLVPCKTFQQQDSATEETATGTAHRRH